MYCKRCNVKLCEDERQYGKCVHCLVKGYKWAMTQLYRQIEELEKRNSQHR